MVLIFYVLIERAWSCGVRYACCLICLQRVIEYRHEWFCTELVDGMEDTGENCTRGELLREMVADDDSILVDR